MKYTVIITEEQSGKVSAIAPGLLEHHVRGTTRQEVIRKMRQSIATLLNRSEIIQIDVPAEPRSGTISREPPWEFFGTHQNDLAWGEFFEEVDQHRSNPVTE